MPDEITFMDLASLLKITPNTPFEKLGSALNTNTFDASNLAGTLKMKGLIEFTSNYPGPNTITITEGGQNLIKEADVKSTTPLDMLDESILTQLSGGKRLPLELQNTLSLRSKDLAMRLYKLNKLSLMVYELKNGGVELLLTEKGFLASKANASMQKPATTMQGPTTQGPMPSQAGMPGPQTVEAQPAAAPEAPAAAPTMMPKPRKKMRMLPILIVLVVIVVIVVVFYMYRPNLLFH